MEYTLNLVVPDLFLLVDRLLQACQLFLIAHQQAFGRIIASKISFSSLESCSKSFLVEQIFFIRSAWLYGMLFFNSFGCSELMLNKGLVVCFLPKYFGM